MKEFPNIPGCELYLAGGCVRDTLLGKQPKDRDFVVITKLAFSELVKVISEMPNCKVFLAKPEFLTIRCTINNEVIDLVYPRKDGNYSDNRRPDNVECIGTIEEDSNRRDFTINAMYMDSTGKVFDFHNGLSDLKDKIIRTVGNPLDRFEEDYLRILRAARFSITLGFNIEEDTYDAMTGLAIVFLENVCMERIKDELNKALKHNPGETFWILSDLMIFELLTTKGLSFELTNKR